VSGITLVLQQYCIDGVLAQKILPKQVINKNKNYIENCCLAIMETQAIRGCETMQEQTIDISFPVKEGILTSLKETKDEFTKDVIFLSSLLFYRKRRLSLGKAAELAGLSKVDFITKLQEEKEHIFDYSENEMDEIFEDVAKIK